MEVTLASPVESLLHLLQILPRICLIQQQGNLPTATPGQASRSTRTPMLPLINLSSPRLFACQATSWTEQERPAGLYMALVLGER